MIFSCANGTQKAPENGSNGSQKIRQIHFKRIKILSVVSEKESLRLHFHVGIWICVMEDGSQVTEEMLSEIIISKKSSSLCWCTHEQAVISKSWWYTNMSEWWTSYSLIGLCHRIQLITFMRDDKRLFCVNSRIYTGDCWFIWCASDMIQPKKTHTSHTSSPCSLLLAMLVMVHFKWSHKTWCKDWISLK